MGGEFAFVCLGMVALLAVGIGSYLYLLVSARIGFIWVLAVVCLVALRFFYHYVVVRRLDVSRGTTQGADAEEPSQGVDANLCLAWLALLLLASELATAVAVSLYIVNARNVDLNRALGLCEGSDFRKLDVCINGNLTLGIICVNLLFFIVSMLPFYRRACMNVFCQRHAPAANQMSLSVEAQQFVMSSTSDIV